MLRVMAPSDHGFNTAMSFDGGLLVVKCLLIGALGIDEHGALRDLEHE